MSLQHAAKHLEKHGRNGDTMLVHMSKGEVKSLNDLAMAHGGHLTINPHTGLAEAGFLKKLLPMIAGAALTATGVGAPMAALMVGGGYAAATGSLKKGLMAGLGAYGGAGLGTSLAQAGASSVAPEVAQGAVASTTPAPVVDMAATPVAPTAEYIPVSAPDPTTSLRGNFSNVQPLPSVTPAPLTTASVTPAVPEVSGLPPMTSNPAYELKGATPGMKMPVDTSAPSKYSLTDQVGNYNLTKSLPTSAAPATSPLENMTMGQRFEAMKQGATFDNLTNWAKQNPMSAYSMGASLLMPEEKPREQPKVDSDPGQQYTYEANATSPTPTADPYGTERKYYSQRYVPRAADGGMMATGGISDAQYNLGSYSDGGRLLRGPGDGVSDSIPAVIGKKQPARLADGEFVVPARIVSELGNGSTEAGARKLYAMMDRIQKARGSTVGKGKVAKNSRAEKYLPA